MSILPSEIIVYGSAVMPDDDTPTDIGGAIATAKRVFFADMAASGNVQIVSSAAGDTTQSVTVTGRDAAGIIISEAKTLSGTTAVPMTVQTTWERLLKAIKSATAAGDVAVEAVTAERTGTAQAGAAATASAMASIDLDAGASATDDTHNGDVIRITAGTGIGQINLVEDYVGATKRAFVRRDWTVVPDNTSVFKVSRGMFFEKGPAEVTEVRRAFYDVSADAAGGAERKYYEKVFFKNTHGTLALTAAKVVESADPSGQIAFAVETALDGVTKNGAGNNRQVAPGGLTFDSATKNVANSGNHTAGAAQAVWLELTLPAGDAATKTTYDVKETGTTT